MPQTREHIVLAKQIGIEHIIVFINKCDTGSSLSNFSFLIYFSVDEEMIEHLADPGRELRQHEDESDLLVT